MRTKNCATKDPFCVVKERSGCSRRESSKESKELHCTVNPGAQVKKDKL